MYDLKCDQCGKEFTRKMRPYRGKNVFCSAVCGQRFHAGKKSDTSFGFEEDRKRRAKLADANDRFAAAVAKSQARAADKRASGR